MTSPPSLPMSGAPQPHPLPWPRAAWRLLCLGALIAQGTHTVRWRFPTLQPEARHQAVQQWARRVLQVLRVEVSPIGQLQAGTRLLVANHVSWLDVMVIHAVLPQARFVAKADVRGWPAIGALVAGAGSLFVDRHQPRLARRAVDEITQTLRDGGLVVVFAEGTTTNGHQVLPFRSGLLKAATTAGCDVQALAPRYREGAQAVSRSCGVQARLILLPSRSAADAVARELAGELGSL